MLSVACRCSSSSAGMARWSQHPSRVTLMEYRRRIWPGSALALELARDAGLGLAEHLGEQRDAVDVGQRADAQDDHQDEEPHVLSVSLAWLVQTDAMTAPMVSPANSPAAYNSSAMPVCWSTGI